MYIYIYIYISISCLLTYMYIYIYIYTHTCAYIYIYVESRPARAEFGGAWNYSYGDLTTISPNISSKGNHKNKM